MSRSPQIFAHRGARAAAPENTLPAFAAALAMDVDGIELDVHCSRDGRLVVIHDFDVAATTDGRGPVCGFTAAELAELDAGSHFAARFAGTGVPTLDEVLDLIGSRCRINIEIKSLDPLGGDAVEPVAALIRQRGLYGQAIVSSFNAVTLIKMRSADERILLGLLYDETLPPFLRRAWSGPPIRPEALHPHCALVDAELRAAARAAGCAVNTWTVNDLAEARRLADLGVDAIITDVPDRLIAGLCR